MPDLFVVSSPLIFHAGSFIGVEMVSGCDKHGRGYAGTALKTKEHAVGLVAAFVATGLITLTTPTNALAISLAITALFLFDVFMLFRAFKAAQVVRKKKS